MTASELENEDQVGHRRPAGYCTRCHSPEYEVYTCSRGYGKSVYYHWEYEDHSRTLEGLARCIESLAGRVPGEPL